MGSLLGISNNMNTLLRLSLILTLHCVASDGPKILFTQALVYDTVIQGAEVKGYLSEYYNNDLDGVMWEFEEQAVALCANAVMEFVNHKPDEGHGLKWSGVAVCDPRLSTPCC